MTSRRFLLLTLCFLAFTSACANATATETGSGGGELEDVIPEDTAEPVDTDDDAQVTEGSVPEYFREIAEAERSSNLAGRRFDGTEDEGWDRPQLDVSTLEPSNPDVQLVAIEGTTDFYDMEPAQPLAACDGQCLELANALVEAATADSFEEPQEQRPFLHRLFWSYCGNCAADFVSIIEVQDGVAQAIETERAIELFAPIDTETELLITFGRLWLTRPTESGWEIIERNLPECTDEDTIFRLSEMTTAGQITEVATLTVPGSPDRALCN